MTPVIEKLEQQFADLKAGKIPGPVFFKILTENMFAVRGEALELLNRTYAWAQERAGKEPQYLGLANIAFAQLAMHEDRIEDGLRFCHEAEVIFTELHDEDGVALGTMMAGAFYRTLGNMDLALRNQFSGYSRLKATGNYPFFFCASSYQLAELYIETGQYERAIPIYQDCITVAEKLSHIGFESLACDGLGLAYHQLGKNGEAKEAFEKAILLCATGDYNSQRSRAMSDFGTFCMDEGDYEKAIEYHSGALELRKSNKMFLASITNMIQLGKIFVLQEKKEEALAIWQQALEQATNLKAKPKISQVHLLLSELYQKKGDVEKGLYHYKAYHTVSEEVNKEDGEKKVKRAEILFAAEQTEKENAIIKTQKAEIERKNRELQETIDELTITKVSRRAKALTLAVAVVMIIVEEPITHFVQGVIGEENFYFSMMAKILIILSLKPIDSAIEHYLLRRVILKKKH